VEFEVSSASAAMPRTKTSSLLVGRISDIQASSAGKAGSMYPDLFEYPRRTCEVASSSACIIVGTVHLHCVAPVGAACLLEKLAVASADGDVGGAAVPEAEL
jgi:hypothetical protein